jgi:hypothetical protein
MEEAVPVRAVLGFQHLLHSSLARDLLVWIRFPDSDGEFQILIETRQRADNLLILKHRVILIRVEGIQLIIVESVENGR